MWRLFQGVFVFFNMCGLFQGVSVFFSMCGLFPGVSAYSTCADCFRVYLSSSTCADYFRVYLSSSACKDYFRVYLSSSTCADCFRVYHINLVALSSNPDYQDSPKSNTLVINSGKGAVQGNLSVDEYSADDHDLPVKVTEVTDSGIHLDWSAYVENQDVAFYKIQWSSVAQPAVSQCPCPHFLVLVVGFFSLSFHLPHFVQ